MSITKKQTASLRNKPGQRGVFITITALLLAGLLILASANIQKSRTLEENATSLAIASERNYFVKQNLTDEIRNTYLNSKISWQIDGNKFIYNEIMPDQNAKEKITQNLLKLKSFFYDQFPQNPNFAPESIDTGKIFVYDKNLTFAHSQTSGFGTNKKIYMNYFQKKFASIKIDMNISSQTAVNSSQNLPLCTSCTNPLALSIIARNSAGTTIFSFSNTIDLSQTGKVDFNTSPGATEISLDYNSQIFSISTNTTQVSSQSTFTFNDPYLEAGIDKNAIKINEMSAFGIEG